MPRKSFETDVADFTQAFGLLVRRVRAAASAQELSLTASAVMARLAKDGPATTADLARGEGMKPQSMGNQHRRARGNGHCRAHSASN